MSQHRAPTAVTIAPIDEKSGLGLWIEKYWKIGAIVVAAVCALILYRVSSTSAKRTERDTDWGQLLAVAPEDPGTGMLSGPPAELRQLSEAKLKDSPTGGWALYIGATTALEKRDFDQADALLAELRSTYPKHALVVQPFREEQGAATSSVVDRLRAHIESERAFVRDHPGLFGNPELPADAPRVKLTTDRGVIVVALYANLAPKHVENFLKLARENYYVGTKFHAVFKGEYIQGGDPNSIDKDAATWGQGGPDYTLDLETPALRHFSGVISAVPATGDPNKSSGSQFLITTADVHGLDRTHVPFGKVVEGLDVLKAIENSPVVESTLNRPETPTAITAIEVL